MTPAILHDLILKCVAPFRLTGRELDVVTALASGAVTARDIARNLGVTESTVQNHIDNISQKSGLGGKSEILAFLVQKMFLLFENARFFMVTPHILIIEDQSDLADGLCQFFRAKGCQSSVAYSVSPELERRVVDERIDLIICDQQLGPSLGLDFIRNLHQNLAHVPTTMMLSGHPRPPDADLSRLARTWLQKPFTSDAIFELAVQELLNSERRAGRQERAEVATSVVIDGKDEFQVYELGPGGMAVHSTTSSGIADSKTQPAENPGKLVQFELQMPDDSVIRGQCTPVWSQSSDGEKVGLRFSKIDPEDTSYLRDYVRTSNILKFLPLDRQLRKTKVGKAS